MRVSRTGRLLMIDSYPLLGSVALAFRGAPHLRQW